MSFFGTHLVDKGLVTPAQIVSAIELQRARRVPLSALCLRRGLLVAADVLRMLDVEKQTGELFEDSVVRHGLLSKEVVSGLVRDRDESGPRLGEILVEIGALTRAQLDQEVETFLSELSKAPDPERLRQRERERRTRDRGSF